MMFFRKQLSQRVSLTNEMFLDGWHVRLPLKYWTLGFKYCRLCLTKADHTIISTLVSPWKVGATHTNTNYQSFFINTTINNYLVFSSYLVSFVFSSYLVSFVFSSYLVSFITFVASISFELYYKCLLHFFITSVRFTYVQRYPFYVTISVLFTYVKN